MAKKDNTIWWVIGVIAVLVILVGGGFGIFAGNKTTTPKLCLTAELIHERISVTATPNSDGSTTPHYIFYFKKPTNLDVRTGIDDTCEDIGEVLADLNSDFKLISGDIDRHLTDCVKRGLKNLIVEDELEDKENSYIGDTIRFSLYEDNVICLQKFIDN